MEEPRRMGRTVSRRPETPVRRERANVGASAKIPLLARRTCILILGMHRSGTSAITRVLNLLGAELPRHMVGPGSGNELGHWEPERLVALHDRMLEEANSHYDDWTSITPGTLPEARLGYYKDQIRRC